MYQVKWNLLSRVQLFVTPWTIQSMSSLGQNTGVGSLSLLQGIFPTQGSNQGLLCCRWILYQLSYQGSPLMHQIPYLNLPSDTVWISFPNGLPLNESSFCIYFCTLTYSQYIQILHACSVISVMSNSGTLWTVARQAPLSMGFSRQEYWSGLPCSPPGNLPDPRIEPGPPASLALQEDSLLLSHQESPIYNFHQLLKM